QESLGEGWVAVHAFLVDSEDFRKAVNGLHSEQIVEFSRRVLKPFHRPYSIEAEIRLELAKSARARLREGRTVDDGKQNRHRKREAPPRLSPLNQRMYNFMQNRKSASKQEFVDHVWGEEEGQTITEQGVKSALFRFNQEPRIRWKLTQEKGRIERV